MRCRTRHAGGCRGGRVHTAAKVALGGGVAPPYLGLYSVQYDGAGETAQHTSADSGAPHNHASGAIAMWIKTTDPSSIDMLVWQDAASNNRVLLIAGAGDEARMLIRMNGVTKVDKTGTDAINDGAWHLVGMTWTWATGIQLYVDGVADGALEALTDTWPASPAMDTVSVGFTSYAGQIARAAQFASHKSAAWWSQISEKRQSWTLRP